MRKAALLLGTLTLIFPVSIRSSELHSNPSHVFQVNLADDFPIRLSPRIHFSVPEKSDQVSGPDSYLGMAAFKFSLGEHHWIRLPYMDTVFICE